jgi:DNA-binding response OmpR family regulator
VIEDDPDVRTLIAEVCRLQGHEVLEAANGADAIELGLGGQPDLVLVDWVLPDISGTEVILELRRQGVLSPMVMLTGRSTKTDEVVGLEVGADDYITTP